MGLFAYALLLSTLVQPGSLCFAGELSKPAANYLFQADRTSLERLTLHDQIILKLTRGYPSSPQPTAIIMAGTMGAGKSTIVDRLEESQKFATFLRIDPDRITKLLPEFEAWPNKAEAYTVLRGESVQIGQKLMSEAIRKKLNFIIDTTGARSTEILAPIKKGRYSAWLIHVDTRPELAFQGAQERAARTGRSVSYEEIQKKSQSLGSNLKELEAFADGKVEIKDRKLHSILARTDRGRRSDIGPKLEAVIKQSQCASEFQDLAKAVQ